MLLNRLNNREKKAFLQLAHYVAKVDNEFAKYEKELIQKYSYEMGIENEKIEKIENLEEVLDIFETEESKNIMFLEIILLIFVDNKFHKFEEQLLYDIMQYYKIDNIKYELYVNWAKSMSAMYHQAKALVYMK